MIRVVEVLALIALPAAMAVHAADGISMELRHNPFERPPRSQLAAEPDRSITAPSQFELRAILDAGRESMANVDGVIVQIGEEINGYRLIEVRDKVAVFEKDGARMVLTMEREK